MRLRPLLATAFAAVALAAPAGAEAGLPKGFSLRTVTGASGFTSPTAFAYAPDGRIFVAQQDGLLFVIDGGFRLPFLDLRSEVNAPQYKDRGLLGLALDPAFTVNHRIYLAFSKELDPANPDAPGPSTGYVISITQSAANRDVADPATRVTLLNDYDAPQASHSIDTLRFDQAGSLLASLGDSADWHAVDATALTAQSLDSLHGKLIRIDPATGAGIPSNPFYDAANPSSVRSRILAYGLRNPFRFTVDPTTGQIYVADVGWNTWEEMDVIPTSWTNPVKQLNFGWPCYEGGLGKNGLPEPAYQSDSSTSAACHALYRPSEGGTGRGATGALFTYGHVADQLTSITGGPRYRATAYPKKWQGRVFFADYALDAFYTYNAAYGVQPFGTAGGFGAPVDLQVAPDGNIAYLGIVDGTLHEIVRGAALTAKR